MSATNPNARVGDTQIMGAPASFVATRENVLATENTALRERAEAAEAELASLKPEVERHRRANLVRAVTQGFDEWIVEAVNAEDWDAIPWRVTKHLRTEVERLRSQLGEAVEVLRTARVGLANYEPDPQHYTVTVNAFLSSIARASMETT